MMDTISTALLAFSLVGMYVCFHIFRPQKRPADSSNRINKIRMVHYVLTRYEHVKLLYYVLTNEHKLAALVEWLKKDEGDIAPLPSMEKLKEIAGRQE